MARRRAEWTPNIPASQTPWQERYRQLVGQLSTGGCLEPATLHLRVIARSGGEPRPFALTAFAQPCHPGTRRNSGPW